MTNAVERGKPSSDETAHAVGVVQRRQAELLTTVVMYAAPRDSTSIKEVFRPRYVSRRRFSQSVCPRASSLYNRLRSLPTQDHTQRQQCQSLVRWQPPKARWRPVCLPPYSEALYPAYKEDNRGSDPRPALIIMHKSVAGERW